MTILPRRRAFLSALGFAAVLVAAGCAQQETKTDATPSPGTDASPAATAATGEFPPAPGGEFKVALITPGKISDKGWSQSANDGLQKIKGELGATVSPATEEPALAQVEGIFRNLAQDGNQLIFAHGSEYDEAAKKVAPDFPKTTFVVMGGRSSGPNLTPIQPQGAEATYLAGMVAAGMTKTGKLGLIGPSEIPIIKDSFHSFEKGAKSIKPDVKITTTFIGSEDIAKGKQQAQALLDGGADVLMHNANAAGQGVAQAVTDKDGAMFIGANADQRDLATPKNIGSFLLDVPQAMLIVARRVKDGKGDGKPLVLGAKDKAVGFVFNPGFKGTVSEDIKAKMKQAEEDMAAKKLDPK